MVSAAMAIEDQSGGTWSDMVLPTDNCISLDSGPNSLTGNQLKDQFPTRDDYAPKVRKPYTITKQRERWTEEEHKKFLEALKLHGRAWRRIEEHVGTKTAVQIRSHAQKFFSKLVRESSNDAVNSIEIPPPRPKRKPMHPYPRKSVPPVKIRTLFPDQAISSASPNLSISDQENQSPTSVLSAIGSDTLGTTESNTPNGSLSPVSSAAGENPCGFLLETDRCSEENRSLLPVQVVASSGSDEEVPVKVELLAQDNDFVKEGSAEVASMQSLKLFGKTVLVTDSCRPSSPTMGACKSLSPDTSDGRPVQTLPWNLVHMDLVPPGNTEITWSPMHGATAAALYYMQFPNKNSHPLEVSSGPLPWAFSGGTPFCSLPPQKPIPIKAHPFPDSRETQDCVIQKEGFWIGSANAGGGDGNKNWEVEIQSCLDSFDREYLRKPTEKEQKTSPGSCMKGFVPYKRCLAERNAQSSMITGEEMEEQRIRLCL